MHLQWVWVWVWVRAWAWAWVWVALQWHTTPCHSHGPTMSLCVYNSYLRWLSLEKLHTHTQLDEREELSMCHTVMNGLERKSFAVILLLIVVYCRSKETDSLERNSHSMCLTVSCMHIFRTINDTNITHLI
jgi:hypothetical protein